jgi:hypothetical protein
VGAVRRNDDLCGGSELYEASSSGFFDIRDVPDNLVGL